MPVASHLRNGTANRLHRPLPRSLRGRGQPTSVGRPPSRDASSASWRYRVRRPWLDASRHESHCSTWNSAAHPSRAWRPVRQGPELTSRQLRIHPTKRTWCKAIMWRGGVGRRMRPSTRPPLRSRAVHTWVRRFAILSSRSQTPAGPWGGPRATSERLPPRTPRIGADGRDRGPRGGCVADRANRDLPLAQRA
jgi:hypothetical protein